MSFSQRLKGGWIYEAKTASHLPNLRHSVLRSDGILSGLPGSYAPPRIGEALRAVETEGNRIE
jgi:hypothetical protein